MPLKKKGPMIASLIIIGLLVVSGAALYIKKGKDQGTQNRRPQTVRRQMGSVREKKAVKRPIPKTATRPTRQPIKKPEIKTSAESTTTSSLPSVAREAKPEKTIDYEREMNELNNLIKANDKDPDAFYNRGLLYDHKGNLRMAEQDYTKAIEINKAHDDAYYNRAMVYVKMKKFQQALKDFSEAIKLKPRAVDAYCNRGNVQFQMGKMDSALEDYSAALKMDPNDGDLYYNRAIVYGARGEKSKSMADLQEAAKLGHDKARAYLKLPPAKPKESKTPVKPTRVSWGMDPNNVKIPANRASGKIHGKSFTVESAKIENGILTLRQGKQIFPDHALMIFLFLQKGERLEGKKYNISKDQGSGVPPIHMKWKPEGTDIPETEIFMKDYAMRLEFGKRRNHNLSGKIYLSLPDELKSFLAGNFTAKVE